MLLGGGLEKGNKEGGSDEGGSCEGKLERGHEVSFAAKTRYVKFSNSRLVRELTFGLVRSYNWHPGAGYRWGGSCGTVKGEEAGDEREGKGEGEERAQLRGNGGERGGSRGWGVGGASSTSRGDFSGEEGGLGGVV